MTSPRGVSWRAHCSRLLTLGLALAALGGCQFFSRTSPSDAARPAKRTGLPPLQSASDALRLDVVIADRRADDPLIGSLLWQEIDQVGAVSTETRELLLENGCLVGHAAAAPPPPLLKLFGVSPEIDGGDSLQGRLPRPKITGRTYSVQSGTESEIQISDLWPECDLHVADSDRTRQLQLKQARCVMRLKPIRLQDGWVRVEFTPEIHHGEMKMRHLPTDELGWALKSAQNVEQCYSQRFAVTLNVGESAVVTAAPQSEETLGDRFFRREQEGELRQRVLIVRLVDMGRTTKPVD